MGPGLGQQLRAEGRKRWDLHNLGLFSLLEGFLSDILAGMAASLRGAVDFGD